MASDEHEKSLKLSREELYQRIWSTPATKLAKEFGISDVALAKICKKFNIPKPGLGHWARKAVGQLITQLPLPPWEGEKQGIVFDLQVNQDRRANYWRPKPTKTMNQPTTLPGPEVELCPMAKRIQVLANKEKPDATGRVRIQGKSVPIICVSPEQIEPLSRAIHMLVEQAKILGYELKDDNDFNRCVRFVHEEGYVTLEIEEGVAEIERPVTKEQKRRPSWTWENKVKQLTGKFCYRIVANPKHGERNYWKKKTPEPLLTMLSTIIERLSVAVEKFKREKIRAEEREIEWKKRQQEEEKKEKQREHLKSLRQIREKREENFAKAAEWWVIYNNMLQFVEACEARWRQHNNGELNEEQKVWLIWAKRQAELSSPFTAGYPHPKIDGSFNEDVIPVGGPYPAARTIPTPNHQQRYEEASEHSSSYYQEPSVKPYPFWLKYQK
ncbi:MAG: hypothetical protein LBH01_09320 [Verrucomicrobiales bacterium]|nr:hypothetical protein [Verrucomicrobiales bacterium]